MYYIIYISVCVFDVHVTYVALYGRIIFAQANSAMEIKLRNSAKSRPMLGIRYDKLRYVCTTIVAS